MKIVHSETLLSSGDYAGSMAQREHRAFLLFVLREIEHPVEAGDFIVNPMPHGNGVTLIKRGLMAALVRRGWMLEDRRIDATLESPYGRIAVEWETGNVSSCHRALNKMAIGLLRGELVGATLILPSRTLANYLTDRIGCWEELAPYLDLWRAIPATGVLDVVVIEHDSVHDEAPLIEKTYHTLAVEAFGARQSS